MSAPHGEVPSVLFINRVFPPQVGATGELVAELGEHLTARGVRVTVLTGAGADATSPATGAAETNGTDQGGPSLHVETVPQLGAGGGEALWRRALTYGALYPGLFARALRLPPHDVIVTKTDPPLQLLMGPLLARLKGAALVHWAQDLYPEVAEAVGVIERGGLAARTLRRLSTRALRRHDRVVAVGRCMAGRLDRRGLTEERVEVIPNWAARGIAPVPHAGNPFRRRHGLEGRFVVMYSGNMGRAHAFGPVLGAAARLEAERPGVLFLFVGEGAQRPALEAEVARRRLTNVRFLPFQPRARLAESLSAADLHLATMQEATCGLVVPSKVYGILAAGRPCVFLGPGRSEAARLLREHACGTVLERATAQHVAFAIAHWQERESLRRAAGERAYRAARAGRRRSLDRFAALLTRLAARPTPGER